MHNTQSPVQSTVLQMDVLKLVGWALRTRRASCLRMWVAACVHYRSWRFGTSIWVWKGEVWVPNVSQFQYIE
jgi:hypothetical protein